MTPQHCAQPRNLPRSAGHNAGGNVRCIHGESDWRAWLPPVDLASRPASQRRIDTSPVARCLTA